MNLIQAVLWDMDGVLIDSERIVQQAFVEVMSAHNIMDNPAERYLEIIGFNRESMLNWYSQFVSTQELAEFCFTQVFEAYVEKSKTLLTLKPGVIDALEAVQAMGLPQMVVTSSRTDVARLKLGHFNLLPYFEGILGGDLVKYGKPHPEPYLTGAQHLKTATENVLVLEDSENGVKSGVEAGCMVLHIPDLIPTHEDWHSSIYGALDSLESFPQWLETKQMGVWV